MADTLTKSVAARVPMDTYVDIIKKAADLRMTVSDYLIMKLFENSKSVDSDTYKEKDQIIDILKKQIKDLESSLIKAQEANIKAQQINQAQPGKLPSSKNDSKVIEKMKAQEDLIKSLESELKVLRKQEAKLEDKVKSQDTQVRSLRTKLQHRDQKYNEQFEEIKQLKFELSSVKEQAEISNEIISELTATNEIVYKELEGFNERNTNFFGNEPIGDEFLVKIKRLLYRHI